MSVVERKFKILIVDDVIENIQVAMNILKEDGYDFSYAKNGEDALKLVRQSRFDLILLDIMMPGIDGFEVARRIKEDPRLAEIPIIFVTAKVDIDSLTQGFEVGGVDYITKPFHAEELLARVRTHLQLYRAKKVLQAHNLTLEMKVKKETQRILSEMEENQKEMIFILSELIESVSDETGKHVQRVAEYSYLLAKYCPILTQEDAEIIYAAAPLHDIGKLALSHDLLHKTQRLSDEAHHELKMHTTKGHEFLKRSKRKFLKAADIIAYQHHEKWNGKGYPQGLKGEEIHIYGRIVALADVFDALTHKRSYKEAWSVEEAVQYIIDHSGTQFDPKLVEIFQEHLDEFLEIA